MQPSEPSHVRLTGKTYLDVLGQARMSLIYLREGPISPNEIEMLSSLRQEVDAQVEAGRLILFGRILYVLGMFF